MFRKEFQAIDVEQAKQLAYEAFGNLVAADEAAKAFKVAEQAEIDRIQAIEQKDRSLALPAVGNVRAHCKGFIQKADHFGGLYLISFACSTQSLRVIGSNLTN
jgi:adenylosuccinate lyase